MKIIERSRCEAVVPRVVALSLATMLVAASASDATASSRASALTARKVAVYRLHGAPVEAALAKARQEATKTSDACQGEVLKLYPNAEAAESQGGPFPPFNEVQGPLEAVGFGEATISFALHRGGEAATLIARRPILVGYERALRKAGYLKAAASQHSFIAASDALYRGMTCNLVLRVIKTVVVLPALPAQSDPGYDAAAKASKQRGIADQVQVGSVVRRYELVQRRKGTAARSRLLAAARRELPGFSPLR